MRKFLSHFAMLLVSAVCCTAMLSSCDDDNTDNGAMPSTEPPTFSVALDQIGRTSVDFTIQSSQASDYAYIILEKNAEPVSDAKELFTNGTSGMIENGTVTINSLDVDGGNEYILYVATRKINPYIYSEVKSFDLSTDIPYTKLLTLNHIGYTDFSYHIEMPEGAERMKHMVIRKTDYDAVRRILSQIAEVTMEQFLETFGHIITESTESSYDKYGKDAAGDGFDIHIHSGNTFLAMAGVINEDGKVDASQFECVEFNTRTAEVSPYDINVAVTTTSTSATVSLSPDPEIVNYRAIVNAKSEFDYDRFEGEQQVRYSIIGHWDDSTNTPSREYSGDNQISANGLIPNTPYEVGIIGFDAQGREKFKMVQFITGKPTGPAPTLTISDSNPPVATPWNSMAYIVKATNAVEVRYGYWLKSQVDNVLDRGTTMETLILSNGKQCSDDELSGILSPEGVTFETIDLLPETEYVFGVYARTNEYVAASDYRVFKTDEMPQIGGTVRKNMPGNYIATTTDENDEVVTFPVTITTGVNDVTTAEYSSINRLVALGFGPADKFPYKSPNEIASETPNTAYGPKWFIEFTDDGIRVPNSANKAWTMGDYNGAATYIKGYGIRETANGPRAMEFDDDFVVEVSEDGNTITVKGTFHDIGNGGTCYPAMYTPSGWISNTYHFKCTSDIVLTRQTASKSHSLRNVKPIGINIVKIGASSIRATHEAIASKLKK